MKAISKYDTKLTLDYILNTPESVIFERKGIFKPDGTIGLTASKVANHIIGMLNAEGGVLVLGINDGQVEDLSELSNFKSNDYKQLVFDFIKPPCNIKIEEVIIEGKLILIYHIDTDKERVFCRTDNENVYFRNGDETIVLDREWVRKLEYDKSIRKFEDEIREDFQYSDFRESVINFYKDKINYEGSLNDLLVYRNLAVKREGNYIYKNSAILLFAENPENYIPSASVRYVRYDGNKQKTGVRLNIIKDERFEGCIPRLIELLKRFLNNVFRDYYYLNLETGKFSKILEYPEEAWLEGVVNALTHRSYNLQGNVIYIKHFDDRLEISNSGPLPSIVTVENIKNTRFSRNPRIARVLSEIGYVRELNEGVNRIYDSMKESFLDDPIYIDENDIVTLILRNNVSKNDETISEQTMKKVENNFRDFNNSQRDLINFLIVNKSATLIEIKDQLNISIQMVRNYLNGFIEQWIIIRESDKKRDKNALYKLKK